MPTDLYLPKATTQLWSTTARALRKNTLPENLTRVSESKTFSHEKKTKLGEKASLVYHELLVRSSE